MRLSFRVELQSTPTQRQSPLRHAGNARWAYNWGLASKNAAWTIRKAALAAGTPKAEAPRVPSAVDLHRELNQLKKLPVEAGGVPWMYEASKCAPQEALRNLDLAFVAFFRRCKAGESSGYPRFKSRNRGIGSFRLTGRIRADKRSIVLPMVGRVRIQPGEQGYLPFGVYGQVSVTERAGRWYATVVGPETAEAAPNGRPAVGVDLGVAQLATLSDGTVFDNPRALAASQKKLKRAQRAVSRKKKGSSNRNKARARLARAHARVANVRRDALHKATTALAKNHGTVVLEDLHVRNLTKSGGARKRGLNRVVLDAAFGEFRRQLTYKARLYGCALVVVPAAYTSQRCSACGHTEAGNRPSQAVFCCLSCGFRLHADWNAALNLLAAGSCPEAQNACGADVSHGGLTVVAQSASKQESAAVS